MVQHLLSLNRSRTFLDAPDGGGRTALALAAAQGQPCLQVVAALVAARASVNTRDAGGRTPLMAATAANAAQVRAVLGLSVVQNTLMDFCTLYQSGCNALLLELSAVRSSP